MTVAIVLILHVLCIPFAIVLLVLITAKDASASGYKNILLVSSAPIIMMFICSVLSWDMDWKIMAGSSAAMIVYSGIFLNSLKKYGELKNKKERLRLI